jgi:hypothetical protein
VLVFRLLSVRRCERGYSQHWAPGTRCQNYPSTKSMQHVRHYQYRPPIIFHFALQLVNLMLFRDCVLCFISRCLPQPLVMVPDFQYSFDTRNNQRCLALSNESNFLNTKTHDFPLLQSFFRMLEFMFGGDGGD